MKSKAKRSSTLNTNERKWLQPRLQLFSLLNLVVDENWVFADIVCCSSSFKNDAVYDVPIYSNFFL